MRSYQLLNIFLKDARFYSLDSLASSLNVSTRTIRNELNELINNSCHHAFRISEKSKKGYYLSIEDEKQFANYLNDLKKSTVKSPNERRTAIFIYLLLKIDYITIAQLGQWLKVSESVIKTDLGQMDQFTSEVFFIEKKPHYGLKINGSVAQRIMKLFNYYNCGNETLLEIYEEFINADKEKEIIKFTDSLQVLSKNFQNTQLSYNISFLLFLLISFNSEHSVCLTIEKFYKRLKEERFHSYYQYLMDQLGNRQETIVDNENIDQEKVNQKIELFFLKLDNTYQTKMSNDFEFMKLIKLHIFSLLRRQNQIIDFQHPLIEEMSKNYPQEFDFSLWLVKDLESEFDIRVTPAEVALICTHLAVHSERYKHVKVENYKRIAIVCSTGGGSAHLIKLKAGYLFPNAQIQTFSFHMEIEIEQYRPDIIFSICELEHEFDVPVIPISEVGMDMNPNLLFETIERQKRVGINDENRLFLSLFNKNGFCISKKKMNYQSNLKLMGESLEKSGIVQLGFSLSLLERENLLSTSYGDKIAIPHALEPLSIKNMISVCIFSDKETHEEKIIFMLAIEKDQLDLTRMITEKIVKLINKPNALKDLFGAKNYAEFYLILKNNI